MGQLILYAHGVGVCAGSAVLFLTWVPAQSDIVRSAEEQHVAEIAPLQQGTSY